MSLRGVKQSVTGRYGNCTAACLATILDLPLEEVFDPAPYWAHGSVLEGFSKLNRWLYWFHGGTLHQVAAHVAGDWRPDGYWIATTEERDAEGKPCLHATVWLRDEFVWNPEPGYDGPPHGPLLAVNFLVPSEEAA